MLLMPDFRTWPRVKPKIPFIAKPGKARYRNARQLISRVPRMNLTASMIEHPRLRSAGFAQPTPFALLVPEVPLPTAMSWSISLDSGMIHVK